MSDPQHTELLGLTIQQLTEIAESLGQPGYRARQLLDGLHRQRWSRLEQFTMLPSAFRQRLSDSGYSIGLPTIEKKFVSTDGTIRYLLAFADGQSVETVWMPEGDGGEAGDGSEDGDAELREQAFSHQHSALSKGKPVPGSIGKGPSVSHIASVQTRFRELETRNLKLETLPQKPGTPSLRPQRATICVSSQVGCAVECAFCMTALLGLKRNLSAGEIVGQILAVLNDQQVELQRDRVNLVFMGQGEPFLNYDNFMQAVRLLVEAVGIPESRMTVSTSGIVPR